MPFHSMDEQIGFVLRRAMQAAHACTAEYLRPFKLTSIQFAALARLAEYGELSQNRLGRLLDMPPANIHTLVAKLQSSSLVDIRADEKDRRLHIVSLSSEGREMFKKLAPYDQASTNKTLASFSSHEREILFSLLNKIIQSKHVE